MSLIIVCSDKDISEKKMQINTAEYIYLKYTQAHRFFHRIRDFVVVILVMP